MATSMSMHPHALSATSSVRSTEASTPLASAAPIETDVEMDPEQTEDARRLLAVSALDSMKTGHFAPYADSATSSTSASVTANSSQQTSPATSLGDLSVAYGIAGQSDIVDEHFLDRVSQMPIVSGALKGYERARNSNRVVRYGADLVESGVNGVRKIGTPVIGRVIGPEQLGQLDDFACRQLDRLGGTPVTPSSSTNGTARPLSPVEEAALAAGIAALEPVPRLGLADEEGLRPRRVKGKAVDRSDAAAAAALLGDVDASTSANQLAKRSRWQSLIAEAGGLGAAVSEESMKSMQYCLEWLHYATAHLDHEILVLRDFIASLSAGASSENALVSASDAQQTLANIKSEVVDTIRKVVDVVSTYAGAALPEHAKRFVRQSILSLPVRWTKSVQQRPSDPSSTTSMYPLQAQTQEAAERVMSFAVESLDMLHGVTLIFGESLDRAEAWLERLRVVGMTQQQRHRLADPAASNEMAEDEGKARSRPRMRLEKESMEVDP